MAAQLPAKPPLHPLAHWVSQVTRTCAPALPASREQEYNEFQVKQLTRLIEVTRTDLSKADRQKCMNMITIDAHSRDMVQVGRAGVQRRQGAGSGGSAFGSAH